MSERVFAGIVVAPVPSVCKRIAICAIGSITGTVGVGVTGFCIGLGWFPNLSFLGLNLSV